MIPAIISGISLLAKGWFNNKKAQQKTKLAIEENKARLAIEKQSNNAEWEMAALYNSDKWIKRISFIMFSLPFLIAIIFPKAVSEYFTTAISSMPSWYVDTYIAITGSVWGISTLKTPIQQIIGSFKKK